MCVYIHLRKLNTRNILKFIYNTRFIFYLLNAGLVIKFQTLQHLLDAGLEQATVTLVGRGRVKSGLPVLPPFSPVSPVVSSLCA